HRRHAHVSGNLADLARLDRPLQQGIGAADPEMDKAVSQKIVSRSSTGSEDHPEATGTLNGFQGPRRPERRPARPSRRSRRMTQATAYPGPNATSAYPQNDVLVMFYVPRSFSSSR